MHLTAYLGLLFALLACLFLAGTPPWPPGRTRTTDS